jgi:hypothetical protein
VTSTDQAAENLRLCRNAAIANELVGVAQDELMDRYRYQDEEDIVPLVINSHQISANQSELIFDDGRKARITIEILPK